jgi:dipeptidyl-peptidase-4
MRLKHFAVFALILLVTNILRSQEITVEKIWKKYEFSSANIDGFRSMKDGAHYSKLSEVEGKQIITKHSIVDASAKSTVLVPSEKLVYQDKTITIDDYFFNEDETKILFTTNTTPLYRRSFSATYYLYDLKTGKVQSLDDAHQPQTLAEYSPDGQQVSYIYKNDIFIKNLATGKVSKVTENGKANKIINGTTDWVYEEEFAITKAYGWSPDSKYIAYLRFDEREVKEFSLTYYKDLYPDLYTFKYPKAGEANSKVTAHILTVKSGKTSMIDLGEYEYIPRMEWSGSANKLILQTLNRHQNHLKYHLVDVMDKKIQHKIFFEEKSKTYVEIDNNLLILKDGNTILRTSEMDGFNHIYKLTFDGKSTPITKGNYDVIEFYGIDETNGTIYYTAAEKSPISKAIYRINLDGSSKKSLSLETGTNDAEFTTGMKYFVKTYSTANEPPVFTLCNNEGEVITLLEDNKRLKSVLKNYTISPKEFVKFHSGETELNGWMIKPMNFDASKKYPVFITVYGGPGHNEVNDAWDGNDFMYHQLLAQKGYVVVSVDPRGTMYRGADFKKSTYLQLGKLETEDFIETAKELQKMPFVDANRIGIQGWSYGGFMTSLAMTKGADQFKMGIAVAPVTNWRYYDNIYTERFMRTPAENTSGYDENSPINFVKLLKGKYLLIHGSGDDNVHYQNTMEMVNALVKADKQFDLFIYPNKNHGIYGGNTRNHLFNMMLNYTLENL